jgi:hypothetical protein
VREGPGESELDREGLRLLRQVVSEPELEFSLFR